MRSLSAFPLVLTSVAVVLAVIAPRRDRGLRPTLGLAWLLGAILLSVLSSDPLLVSLGWWLTLVPFAAGLFGPEGSRRSLLVALAVSAALLTVTCFLPAGGLAAGLVLAAAVWIRAGLFPAQGWLVDAFENGPLLPVAFLVAGQAGDALLTRTELPGWLGAAALVAAMLASLRNFAEHKPRRILANVAISHSAFVVAGLLSRNEEGLVGADVHALVLAVALAVICGTLRLLEVRVMDVVDPAGKLGLAVRTPFLAVMFLIGALALFGLPGTLGYVSEDLLFQGVLESRSWLGLCLLFATAFNAINLLRLYSTLFLGVLPKHVVIVPDALPRERWPLMACVALLVLGGIVPKYVVRSVSPPAAAHKAHA